VAAVRTRPDGLPEGHVDIEDEAPEPSLAELCRECREVGPGACGEPCRVCGGPIARYGGKWGHTHGADRSHRAQPVAVVSP
jgi:hypothetical protein